MHNILETRLGITLAALIVVAIPVAYVLLATGVL
jgi:hypothetical protein